MLSWFQALMPKEARFFDLFEHHAETIVGGAAALRELLNGGDDQLACAREIKRHENAADASPPRRCSPCVAPSSRPLTAATSAI